MFEIFRNLKEKIILIEILIFVSMASKGLERVTLHVI